MSEPAVNLLETESVAPEKPIVGPADYLFTVLFGILFVPMMIFWDLIQRVTFYLKGESALHRIAASENCSILRLLQITGATYEVENSYVFPNTNSYIVISNHQSMFDICLVHGLFWQNTPRFIAKRELGKWIPGISFNLRAGRHTLIDRAAGASALAEIIRSGKLLNSEPFSAVIFPEGTRARDGKVKKFKPGGLNALLRHGTNAKIALVAIDGSWRFQTYNCWPIPRKAAVKVKVLELLDRDKLGSEAEIIAMCEARISEQLQLWRNL